MLRNEILDMMAKLKLRGMLAVFDEVLANGRKARWATEKIIMELLKAEAAERHLRSIRYRMGQAKFPVLKDLDNLIFKESSVDENQIRSLYEGSFIEECTNLIFVGGTGTGKTHLSIAIAAHAVRIGYRVKFYNLVDLANAHTKALQYLIAQKTLQIMKYSTLGLVKVLRYWKLSMLLKK